MKSSQVSATLFAVDKEKVATFYRETLGLTCTVQDAEHSILDCLGFDLIVHRVPDHVVTTAITADAATKSVVRRVDGALRLNFHVANLITARLMAASLGGAIDDLPPAWAIAGSDAYLGHDPEGNVFKITQRT